MNQLSPYQVAMSLVPGVGHVIAKQLISYFGSAEKVFSANRNRLLKVPGIGIKTAEAFFDKRIVEKAEEIILKCDKSKVKILYFTEDDYPDRIRQLYDAPVILYAKGNSGLNPSRTMGIVGTRRATWYGKNFVDRIVEDLKAYDVAIISGLAYGIDYHAHVAALRNHMKTIGIMAGGFNHVYPSIHIKTANEMVKTGGLISEYPPDIVPEAHFFPERNRLIAGLSDAVIVVEAAEKGGALITAEYANNYNREVFALPGNINVKYSQGCNNLIKKHKANIITSIRDIEYIMNWEPEGQITEMNEPDWEDLSIPEKKIMEVLKNNANELLIDDLSWKSQIPLNQLASHLLNLEFRGFVKALPGKKFRFLY